MNRVAVVFLLLFSTCISLSGQQIHFICYADTVVGVLPTDDRIKIRDRKKMCDGEKCNLSSVRNLVNTIASGIGMQNRIHSVIKVGDEFNREDLLKTIADFQCSQEDIVIFCYLGHGGRSHEDTSELPQMCLGASDPSLYIPLDYVNHALAAKKPRLCIIIAECCNKPSVSISPKDFHAYDSYVSMSPDATTITRNVSNGLYHLFMETNGMVLAVGCQKDEVSWVNENGGLFIDALVNELQTFDEPSCDWGKVIGRIESRVYAKSSLYCKQTQKPYFDTLLRENPQIPTISPDVIDDGIRTVLIKISDSTKSTEERIGLSKSSLSCFTDRESVVRLVGRNRETFRTLTAWDYLLRLASVNFVSNFTILEQEVDSEGRISSMVIHEIHKNNR